MTDPINHNGGTPPQVAPSSLSPLLERNRAFAATGAHAGLTSGHARRYSWSPAWIRGSTRPPSWASNSATRR
jgi:hypothetical protein